MYQGIVAAGSQMTSSEQANRRKRQSMHDEATLLTGFVLHISVSCSQRVQQMHGEHYLHTVHGVLYRSLDRTRE